MRRGDVIVSVVLTRPLMTVDAQSVGRSVCMRARPTRVDRDLKNPQISVRTVSAE